MDFPIDESDRPLALAKQLVEELQPAEVFEVTSALLAYFFEAATSDDSQKQAIEELARRVHPGLNLGGGFKPKPGTCQLCGRS